MGFLDNIDSYLKERKNESRLNTISKRLRNNPDNKGVMKKLNILYEERQALKKALEKKELEIDFCLNYLYYNDL